VDEASGEVFVMDRHGGPGESSGVDRFSFSGGVCSFVEQIDGEATSAKDIFGSDLAYDAASKRLFVTDLVDRVVDVFEVGVGEHFLFAISGAGTPAGSLVPGGVAVAGGVVYVSDLAHGVVDEFRASAGVEEYLGGFPTEPYGHEPRRLAVDAGGDVFVAVQTGVPVVTSQVVEFGSKGEFKGDVGGVGGSSVSVDRGDGDVFVGFGLFVEEFDSGGGLVSRFGGPVLRGVGGLAVDEGSGEVFVADEAGRALDLFGVASVAPGVSTGEVSGLSQTGATLEGVVNPESGSLAASYEFEYATEAEYSSGCGGEPEVLWEELCGRFTHVEPVSAVGVGTGVSGVAVSVAVAGLSADTGYRYRIVGFNANADGVNGRVEGETGSFITPGPPVVGGEQAVVQGAGEAVLHATVSPEGSDTHYYFEYGTGVGYGSRVPASGVDVGAGRVVVSVSEPVSGLAPETEYHFRVLASSSEGTTDGGDASFRTFGAPAGGLPDRRGYELVSRLAGSGDDEDANAYSAGDLPGRSTVPNAQAFESSPEGGVMSYGGDPSGEGNGLLNNEYLATRGGGGWVARDISPPTEGPSLACPGGIVSISAPYELFSSGLGVGVAVMVATPPLVAATGAPACYLNVFVRETSVSPSVAGSYRALITSRPPNRPATEFGFAPVLGKGLVIEDVVGGGSSDLGRVFFAVNDALVAPAVNGGFSRNDVYEWSSAGGVALVSVLANGTGVSGASIGSAKPVEPFEPSHQTHAVSGDGSRVFWTDSAGSPSQLFVREDGEATIPVDKARGGPGASGGGVYWTASVDGSRAFFTDSSQLTREADAGSGANLYQFEVEGEHLIDLTGGQAHAGVVGVLGASEDGSVVYFLAEGVLTSGETNAAGQTPVEGGDNLYVYHAGAAKPIEFLGRLNPEDDQIKPGEDNANFPLGDWRGSVAQETARVTGDGGSLVLVSREQLTAYQNEGHDEVYLYSLAGGGFTCVSCNPTGSSYGEAVLIPDTTNAYQPRWVSEDGDRVFFDTTEALVAGDENETWDVYEWEREGTGSCGTPAGCVYLISSGKTRDGALFDDASADGGDVFFTTRGRLTPEDMDEQDNVFDARVGGGFPYTTPPENCGSEGACRAPQSAPPALPSPATGGGVLPSDSVQGVSESHVSVLSVKHDGAVLIVRVRVSGKGRLTITASGLTGFSRQFTGAGLYTLRIRLSAKGSRRAHTAGGLALALHIHFTPPVGQPVSSTRKLKVKIK